MNLLIFQNPYEFFSIFVYVFKNAAFKKKWSYNRATFSSITRKILVRDIESWYKNMPKIRNLTFIFQKLEKKLKNFKMILKNR